MAKASIAGEPTYVLELSHIEAQAIADLTAHVYEDTMHGRAAARVGDALEDTGIDYRMGVVGNTGGHVHGISIKDDA